MTTFAGLKYARARAAGRVSGKVVRLLAAAAILTTVGGALAVISSIIDYLAPEFTGVQGLTDEVSLGISLVVAAAITFGIVYWCRHVGKLWSARRREALGQALWLGAVLVLIGAFGLINGLGYLVLYGLGWTGTGLGISLITIIAWGVSLGTGTVGIMILAERRRPETVAAFVQVGTPLAATPGPR